MAQIVSGLDLNVNNDIIYTKPKVNANNGKAIGILNKHTMKSFYMSTPLMLTWGVNRYEDEKTGRVSYDMALQFPNDEYNNEDCVKFLKNMQAMEEKIKADAITNSKEWFNKAKLTADAVDALWTPLLKYPKDKNDTSEYDYSRAPSLKVKVPFYDGEFKGIELYSESKDLLFPHGDENNSASVPDFITKASNVATIIQSGGVWVANGKFGVTWKLFQAVVKPKTSLAGKCHISLSSSERERLANQKSEDDDVVAEVTKVEDTDDEEDPPLVATSEVKEEVKEEVKAAKVEDVPKKKVVRKKKAVEE